MKCEKCGRGPAEGVTVYRQNAFGVPGIWRCRPCNVVAVDTEVQEIVDLLEANPPLPRS